MLHKLVGTILGPFTPTQDCDNGLAALRVLLKLGEEVPVDQVLSLQVRDFPFQDGCVIGGIGVLGLKMGLGAAASDGTLACAIRGRTGGSWVRNVKRRRFDCE